MEEINDFLKLNRSINYGLNLNNVQKNQLITSHNEITIDDTYRTLWLGYVPSFSKTELVSDYYQKPFNNRKKLPFSFVLNLTLSLGVESFAESCLLHLEIQEAEYHKPAFTDDTFQCHIRILSIEPTSNKQKTIVESRHYLINQKDEVIFTLKRITLFPRIRNILRIADKPAEFNYTVDGNLREEMIRNTDNLKSPGFLKHLDITDLVLHQLVRPVKKSENLFFTTLLKNTNPIHFNDKRYEKDIIISGGIIVAMVLGIASREFREIIHQSIKKAFHVMPVYADEMLGAFSYVKDIHPLANDLEELHIRTIGLKNTDTEEELSEIMLPLELFEHTSKPVEIINLCDKKCQALNDRICTVVDWKFVRRV